MVNISLRSLLFKAIGITFCTVPVTVCIICYFPLWRSMGGEAVISGATVLLLAIAFVPVFNLIKKALKSPSAYTLWLISFILFFLLSRIANEMTVISFVGLVGNIVGAIFLKLGGKANREG